MDGEWASGCTLRLLMKTPLFRLVAVAELDSSLGACQSNTSAFETTATSGSAAAPVLTPGPWRGVLTVQGQEIPFLFEVKTEAGKPVVYLINKGLNGEKRLRCNEISVAGDSATIRLHPFDAALVVRASGKNKLKGTWVKSDTKGSYRVPLTATAGKQPLFLLGNIKAPYSDYKVKGKWTNAFKEQGGSIYQAIGVFQQNKETVTGTFLTSTGDYLYLEGGVNDDILRLSTFNGNHAFLFVGKLISSAEFLPPGNPYGFEPAGIFGDFYSNKFGHETWNAVLDPDAKLPEVRKTAR